MIIKSINTFVLRVPLGAKTFYSSQCPFPERKSLLVRIETDNGIIGWGEGGQYGPAEPVAAAITHVLAPQLIGRNALDRLCLWEELYAATRDFGRQGSYIEALSAIDIALWDIAGKFHQCPIHQLIGASFRDHVPAYATGCYYREEDLRDVHSSLARLTEEAKAYKEAGFRTIKAKIGLLSIEEDTLRLQAIRSAIGNDIDLLVDANHAYTAASAIRMGRALESLGVKWFEEPVLPEDKEGYARLRSILDIPIAGGECEYTRWGFKDLFTHGCVDIAQPDLCVCGGISEGLRIQSIASSYNIPVIPHAWGSGIALAATLQFLACLPIQPHTANPIALQNAPMIEYDRNPNPLRDDLLREPIRLQDSCLAIPQGAGLGVEIDEAVLNSYCEVKA